MSDETQRSHEPWDELVAAHALHALEPAEELRLLAHVETCPSCQEALDDFSLVAAQLGSLADDEVEPPSWGTLRPRLLPDVSTTASPSERPSASVHRLSDRRHRVVVRVLATAAAVVVLGGGVVAGWQLTRPARPPSLTAALTACHLQAGCRVVEMHGQGGSGAAVLVEAGRASLVPMSMPAPPPGRMYVLWQMPRDGSPIPVVTFRDAHRQTSSVPLGTTYADTAAFAVSLEPAGPMSTRPTDVLAVGAATS